MIDPTWRRIAGVHAEDDGTVGVVWLAHDPASDLTYLYDACAFRRQVFAVIAEGMNARGPWIPVAWRREDEEFKEKLLEIGLRMLPEPCGNSQAVVEVVTREIWQRMDTGRFIVKPVAFQWKDEAKRFYQERAQVPRDGYPLMSATRHAIEMLPYARPKEMPGSKRPNYPKVAIV